MPSTSAADIRRLIYGTSTGTGSLSTADLLWFDSNNQNTYLAAAAAADAEAAVVAGAADKQVGDLRISYRGAAEAYKALSQRLRLQGVRRVAPYAGGISVAAKDTANADTDMVTPKFRTDQFTNPISSSTGAYY